ncbi:MAG: hypothetical protein O9327_05085 [Polaromonas sp.]|nr:hypothetical protein [Polaromonas sp.]
MDLSFAAVDQHWSSLGVEGLIAAMERCEPWVVDLRSEHRQEVDAALRKLEIQLNASSTEAILRSVGRRPELAIEMLGYLRSGRALVLFSWLTSLHPDIVRELMSSARFSSDAFGLLLLDRISTLERQRLLSRTFSPERLSLVMELLAEAGFTSAD